MPTKIKDESPLELTSDQMEQGEAALGGAAKGALLGAKLGTIVPGVGNVVGAVAGGLIGGVGGLIKTKKQQQEEAQQAPGTRYIQTNVNPYNGKEYQPYGTSPFGMTEKPKIMKALTPYTASYSAYNMSAKQASKEPLMQKLSGVSSLQFTEEGLNKLPDNIPGKFGDIVRAEKDKLKED
tara:strand:- start:42 stop:581 length:540 start_codon:yes stop_codon:yes gene_type:complete